MAILAECPTCHKKQSLKNKVCSCGYDLDKGKKQQKVKFWLAYRINKKQRREPVGYSITEARDADGKRRSQKRENRIFDILPEAKMTFAELAKWYMSQERTRPVKDPSRIQRGLDNFNTEFGENIVAEVKLAELTSYFVGRRNQGQKISYINQDMSYVKQMVQTALLNDMVGPQTLKAFSALERLKPQTGETTHRTRILTLKEYSRLLHHSRPHVKPILQTLLYTGMRPGEVKNLKWNRVDLANRFIRLMAEDTKRGKARNIPISDALMDVLRVLPSFLRNNHVFLYKGQPITTIARSLKRTCKLAGIPFGRDIDGGFVLHDMRHTVKTLMVEAQVDKVYRDTIVGHALKGMDAVYINPSEESLHKAMAKYSAWLTDKLENVDQNVDKQESRVGQVV